MKKVLIIIIIQLQIANCLAQHTPNKWVLGSNFTNNLMDFTTGSLSLQSLTGVQIGFVISNAAIGDANSNLLYFSNGFTIFDKQNNVIMNGDTLSPCDYTTTNYQSGGTLLQGIVFIPDPGDSNKIYVFHLPQDSVFSSCIKCLQLAQMHQNSIQRNRQNGQ